MWLTLAIFSSVCLGLYDILKKASLRDNAFVPVLFFATASGAVLFTLLVSACRLGLIEENTLLYVPKVTAYEHFLFFLKSIIVGTSWFLAYMALSHLPLTIVIPIRATGPFWVLMGAMVIFHERFSPLQWVGIIVVLVFFYLFSLAGRKEGIDFVRNKWIFAIIAATIVGAASGLYDKFLMEHYDRMAVQAWFSIYMVFVMLPFLVFLWYPKRKVKKFTWRNSIPAIGIVLSLADFLYFYALSDPESLIGVVSVLRRSSVIIAFSVGAVLFKEGNIRRKAYALVGITIGIVLLVLGS